MPVNPSSLALLRISAWLVTPIFLPPSHFPFAQKRFMVPLASCLTKYNT
jgi:hypothetical protein